MITATELLEEHENDFDGRPQRIQALREPIREYTDLRVPRSSAAVKEWYSAKKGVITKRLNEHISEADADEDSGDDGGDN